MFKNAMVIVFLLVLIPIQVNAGSTSIILEGDVGGYRYAMIEGEDSLIWEIEYEGRTSKIHQNKDNKKDLDQFYSAMSDAARHRFTFLASSGYFMIVCIITLIFYKRRKSFPLSLGMISGFLAFGALYFSVTSFLEMQDAIRDAGHYYLRLVS